MNIIVIVSSLYLISSPSRAVAGAVAVVVVVEVVVFLFYFLALFMDFNLSFFAFIVFEGF